MKQVLPVKENVTGVGALFAGEKPGYAHGGDGFSRSADATQPDDFTVVDGQGDPAHSFSVTVVEFNMQITYLQHQLTSRLRICRPSPMSPTPKINSTIVQPVDTAYQGPAFSMPWASESI